MDKTVIIIGTGGHARVLYDSLRLLGIKVLGMLDKCPSPVDRRAIHSS